MPLLIRIPPGKGPYNAVTTVQSTRTFIIDINMCTNCSTCEMMVLSGYYIECRFNRP